MYAFRNFTRADLLRVAATISNFLERKRFMSTIVDNSNYERQVGGKTVTQLFEPDLSRVLTLADAAGVSLQIVSA